MNKCVGALYSFAFLFYAHQAMKCTITVGQVNNTKVFSHNKNLATVEILVPSRSETYLYFSVHKERMLSGRGIIDLKTKKMKTGVQQVSRMMFS